jgi:hypothetical protein
MMHDELLRAVIGLEYQAALLAAPPLTTLGVGWVARLVLAHLRDRRAAGYAARLVAWAEQVIPAKSARYGEVAALLARRFPMLSGEQLEVLIESEVLNLKTALRAAAPANAMSTTGVVAAAATTTDSGQDVAASGEAVAAASVVTAGAVPTAPAALRVGGA